jgi:ribokinase
VTTDHVQVTANSASGVAMILVDRKGENSIVVAPGANARVTPADVDSASDLITAASAVVLQLEIPLATVRHAIALCQRLGVFTILDPAPAPPKPLPRAFFGVDVLTPNQTEATMLLGGGDAAARGRGARGKRPPDAKQTASELLARGARAVVLKLGRRGCVMVERGAAFRSAKPFAVDVVDTTAAGDAFTGALAVARAEGVPLGESLAFANAAGALCCSAFGAQPALPSRGAVERLLRGEA